MRDSIPVWLFWAALSACFAALTTLFGKVGVSTIHPDYATLIRTAVIFVFTATTVVVTQTPRPASGVSGKGVLFLVLSGLATGASWLCYYRALALGPASKIASVDKMSIVLVALFAIAFLGERLSIRNWIGIALIAVGGILASLRR